MNDLLRSFRSFLVSLELTVLLLALSIVLGITREEYYDQLCELADMISPGIATMEPQPEAASAGCGCHSGGCGCGS